MTTTRSRRPPPVHAACAPGPSRRLETWLWTGPVGHLFGGALDFGHALARYLLARIRGRPVR